MKQKTVYTTFAGDQVPAFPIWSLSKVVDPDTTTINKVKFDGTEFWFYKGTAGTDLDLTVNLGGTTATGGRITLAEATTCGAIVDLINAATSGLWKARLACAFYDTPSANLVTINSGTAIVCDQYGLGGGTSYAGVAQAGVALDISDFTTGALPFACLGPEAFGDGLTVDCSARRSDANTSIPRDIDDIDFAAQRQTVNSVAILNGMKITASAGGSYGASISVYSADANDTLATAKLKYGPVVCAEDTQKDETSNLIGISTSNEEIKGIESEYGERLIAYLTTGGTLDGLTATITGVIGDTIGL